MKVPWRNLEGPAKLLAICVVVFLVSSGLCGLEWIVVFNMRGNGGALGDALIPLGMAELAGMIGSGALAVILVFYMILRAIFGGGAGGDSVSLFPRQDPEPSFPREKPQDDDEKK